MNFYVYKIINLKNNNFYIGKRQCDCEIKDDYYMGSGVEIKKEIEFFGLNNFTKKILAYCDTEEELKIIEASYININIDKNNCLNVQNGYNLNSQIEKLKNRIKNLELEHRVKDEVLNIYKKYYREHKTL